MLVAVICFHRVQSFEPATIENAVELQTERSLNIQTQSTTSAVMLTLKWCRPLYHPWPHSGIHPPVPGAPQHPSNKTPRINLGTASWALAEQETAKKKLKNSRLKPQPQVTTSPRNHCIPPRSLGLLPSPAEIGTAADNFPMRARKTTSETILTPRILHSSFSLLLPMSTTATSTTFSFDLA